MAGPQDWGAIPLTDAGSPASWGAVPMAQAEQQPAYGSDDYVNSLAQKYNVDPDYVRKNLDRSATEVVGGMVMSPELANKGAAGLAALTQPLFGGGAKGSSIGERYSSNLDLQRQLSQDYEAQHPLASTAENIGGSALSLGVGGATTIGAKLLGLTGGLPGMIGMGAVSGAALGAIDPLARGENPLPSMAVGGGLGAAGPAVGRAANAFIQPIATTARGIIDPVAEAARRVAGSVTAGTGGLSGAQFNAARVAGAPVMGMDLGGETTQALARSAANTSPEARQVLNDAINQRFEQQSDRLDDYLNSTFHYPNAQAQSEALQKTAQTVNSANYKAAMNHPNAQAMWDEGYEQLMQSPTMQQAARGATQTGADEAATQGFTPPRQPFAFSDAGVPGALPRYTLRTDANGNQVLPNLQFWDQVKRSLDSQLNMAKRSGDSETLYRVGMLKSALLDRLDAAVPEYQTARSTASGFFGADNALDAGQKYATSRGLNNDDVRAQLAKYGPQETQLFQDGFVSGLINKIRTYGDRSDVVAKIANSPASREQMDLALGPQRSQDLQSFLHVENIMDNARSAVQGNSTTARQLIEMGLAGGAGNLIGGGGQFSSDPTALMHAALLAGAARGHIAINKNVSLQVAKLLTSGNTARIGTAIAMIRQNPRLFAAVQHGDAAVGAIAARSLQPAISNRMQ